MVKIYYGSSYKEAYYNDPLYTDKAKTIMEYKSAYAFCDVQDIEYEDLQKGMTDEQKLAWYLEETGEKLEKVNDRFWDFAEDYFSIH